MSQRFEELFHYVSLIYNSIFSMALPVLLTRSMDNFQITVLITDGKSQDNVQEPAQKLRSQGVHVFAVGVCFICSLSTL